MKITKYGIIRVLLSLYMMVSCILGLTVTAKAADITTFEALKSAIDNAEDDTETTIVLGGDIADMTSNLEIPKGKKIVLDLAGHTINRNLSSADWCGYVIMNNGTLTIKDTMGGGKITGGRTKSDGYGGGIYNNNTLNMIGGTITGNTAGLGGGIFNDTTGTLNINGGTITGNTANSKGGGIYNASGTMTVTGGVITENTAAESGGGIMNNSTLNMTGGTITNNTAYYGGGIYNNSTLNMSGGTITGNKATYGGGVLGRFKIASGENTINITGNKLSNDTVNNVFLLYKTTMTVDSVPAKGSVIGITTQDEPKADAPVTITGSYNGDFSFFTSDNTAYAVTKADGNTPVQLSIVPAKTEWYIGETINLKGKWFCGDDDYDYDNADWTILLGKDPGSESQILSLTWSPKSNQYITSPVYFSKWADGTEAESGEDQINIYITPTDSKPLEPIGIRIKEGSGDSKDDAYKFELIYPDEYTSGGCTVFYDKVTHTVTVLNSGNGEMEDYKDYDSVPWKEIIGDVLKIDIQNNVAYVGDFAFYGNSSTEINIPSSVTYIGDSAFCSNGSQNCVVNITRPDITKDLQIKGIPFNSGTINYFNSSSYVLFDGDTDIEDGSSSSLLNGDNDTKTFNWRAAPLDISITSVHGTVTASVGENTVTKAETGKEVILNVTPDTNYKLKSIIVTSPREGLTALIDLVAVMGDAEFGGSTDDYFQDYDDYSCKIADGKFVVCKIDDGSILTDLSADDVKEFSNNGNEICVDTNDGYEWYFIIKEQTIRKITIFGPNSSSAIFKSVTGASTGSVTHDVHTLTAVTEGSEYMFTMPKKNVTVTAEFELNTNVANTFKLIDGKSHIGYCVDTEKNELYLIYLIDETAAKEIENYDYVAIVDGEGNIIEPVKVGDDGTHNSTLDGGTDGKIHTVYGSVQFSDGSTIAAAEKNAKYLVAFEIKGKTELPAAAFDIVMKRGENKE